MKNILFNRPWWAAAALLSLATVNLRAGVENGVVVGSLCGGGVPTNGQFYGYIEGDPIAGIDPKFNAPNGLALDSSGEYLFVADQTNNRVRVVALTSTPSPTNHSYFTYTFAPNFTYANITRPVGVAVDPYDWVYVLNRGNGTDGSVVLFDEYGYWIADLATGLTNANAIALDSALNAYVTASNSVVKIPYSGGPSTLVTVTASNACLQGLVVMANGMIAACDVGRHGILLINPTNGVITNLTGFNGAGDNDSIWTNSPNIPVTKAYAKFNQPYGLAEAGNNMLVVADRGNHRVKAVNALGTVTNLYGVSSNLWYINATNTHIYPGWWDGRVVVPDAKGDVEARLPTGVLFAPNRTIYVTEDYYHLIRMVSGTGLAPVPPPPPPPPTAPVIVMVITNYGQVILAWSASDGATSYNLKRSPSDGGPYTTITSTSATNYTDTSVIDGTLYYYVVSAVGAGGEGPNSAQVSARVPMRPVPDPRIGWVDFPPPLFGSVFHQVSSFVLNNDAPIVIDGTYGSQTFYTYGATGSSIPDPTPGSASAPVGYADGMSSSAVAFYTVAQQLPDVTFKAVGVKPDGSPNSAIVQARFQYIVANPVVAGNNAAQFTVSDFTADAQMWYTIDGSDPTNSPPSLGPIPTDTILSLQFPPGASNLVFKVVGARTNYQCSAVVPVIFSATNFVPNSITFGFASGEASSDFIGAPGQIFYAPVTLNPLPNATVYSLQFNLTVTNAGPNPGPAVIPGAYFFESFLEKPDLKHPGYYTIIPPAMFLGSVTNPPPAQTPLFFEYNDGWFQPLTFSDNALNLLGVGWLERRGKTNLYDTRAQTLIAFSQPHDTIFTPDLGKVVLGGYAFQIPPSAAPGQTYRIQIGRPSATSDGIGAPGSSVYIAAPTNGSLAAGPINSIKVVTAGQLKYIAGDSAPFRWFNAGDFGNTNLDSSDIEQVFQSAIYYLNTPPPGSDFFDGMDSCGALGVLTPNGYYVRGPTITDTNALQLLFDGNDTTINQIPFGDGNLDVCDVYVSFRRSLDPSLIWWRRFWTNGVLGAESIAQPYGLAKVKDAGAGIHTMASTAFLTNPPSINFAAGDIITSAGQTVYIPITARIFGDYPLRLLMLNLSVVPLDGSPVLTSPVQFTPNAALGAPTLSDSTGNGNYSATWLNNALAGLTGTATLGTLAVTIPAGASSTAAYAIHFDHASASPNGLGSFPKQTLTGLILLSARNSSIFNDGIPDSWRLRYFGTVNNILAQASADADGDSANNWHEYISGTDPTDTKSLLRASSPRATAQGSQDAVIRWPSVSGKRYVIERSSSIFAPQWTPVCTNTGTGRDMEYHDTTGGRVRFYRVHVTP
jgi:hypothetical protein